MSDADDVEEGRTDRSMTATTDMALPSQDVTGVTHGSSGANGEALYQEGMAHYRAHRWAQAKECFLRLRALEPERRGLESLLDELDHLIRLEEMRPDLTHTDNVQGTPSAPSAAPVTRRGWFIAIPVVSVALLVGALALATSGLFAQQAPLSPPATPSSPLLTARALNGSLKVQVAGTGAWQEWGNGRLLRKGDHIRSDNTGAVELILPDGKTLIRFASPAVIKVTRISANGTTVIEQLSGDTTVQADSRLLILATQYLQTQALEIGTSFRIGVTTEATHLGVDRGRLQVAGNGTSVIVGAGEEMTVGPGVPLSVRKQATATSTPTQTLQPTATAQPTKTATALLMATPTALPTTTIPPLPTPTRSPTATPRPIPPTATPMPTATPTPALPPSPTAPPAPPTPTPVPPTNTPLPPTPTPLPPTPTPRR